MATQYKLNITNNSAQNKTFIVFQKNPNLNPWENFSLAWLSKALPANSNEVLEWSTNYGFVAGESGPLQPGARFRTSEITNCDPSSQNKVEASFSRGRCSLSAARPGGQPGQLTLVTNSFNPFETEYAAGIAMSNAPVIVTHVQPNMNYVYSPDMEYWIAYGNYENGQVLSTNVPNAARIEFPKGKNAMNVVLNPNGQFTIIPA
ncbi:MAG TPA: hypothetical protein VK151_06740 [Fluviicola sp.]|nr:hypothetical protein [Fluviicola sp.]